MGDRIQHTYYFEESCDNCGNNFNGKIVITEYPYLVIDNIDSECEGGVVEGIEFYFTLE